MRFTTPAARVRRQAAVSVARRGDVVAAAQLAALLDDSDPVVAHTAIQSLISLSAAEACFDVIDRTDASPAKRAAAVQVLQALHQESVVAGILKRLVNEQSLRGARDC